MPRPLLLLVALIAALATATAAPDAAARNRSAASGASVAPTPTWVGDYEAGDLSQFQDASWNYLPTPAAAVTAPARSGTYAGAYTIPSGGSRCETVPNVREFSEGDDAYFTISTYLATGFPISSSAFQVLTQWKNDGTGSPPLELKVNGGNFLVDGGYGYPSKPRYAWKSAGRAATGTWDAWEFHIKFSATASVGYVDVWRNGVEVIAGWHMPGGTLYPKLSSYWKNGYYRDSAITGQATVYEDDLRVSSTF